MATKKEVTEKKVVETTKKTVANDDLVEVYIPFDDSNPDEDNEYVSVNGVAILIPKGRKVKVKKMYAEAIKISQGMRDYQRERERAAKLAAASHNVNTTY